MASGWSDFFGQKVLDEVFNGVDYVPPTNVYLALCTVAPSRSSGGTEVTGGSYARQPISMAAALSTADISSDANITFTAMPACTVVGAKLMDASTGGNMLGYITALSISVSAGQNLIVPSGSLTWNNR